MQFINNLRGIAILLIVLAHSIAVINRGDSFIVKSIDILVDNATILFVIIAGYLFLFSINNFNYRDYLKNKFIAVIIPYFFISIPAVILYISGLKAGHPYLDMDWFYSLNMPLQYLFLMTTGTHLGPLWFIPMIILFYLFSPLFVYLVRKNLLEYLFPISLIIALYIGRPAHAVNNEHFLYILYLAVYFLPTYLFGMLLMKHQFIFKRLRTYSHTFLFSAVAVYLFVFLPLSLQAPINSSLDLILKMFLSLLLFAFAKQFLEKPNRWLNMFARFSFYLYFIHGYFAGAIRQLDLRIFDFEITGILALSISFTSIILLSFILLVMTKLILKNKSKIFIGI